MYVYASHCINHKGARHGAVGGAGVFGRTGHIGDRALAARAIRRPGRVLRGRRGAGRRRARGPGGESQTLRRGGLRHRGPARGVRPRLRVPHAPCRGRIRQNLSARHLDGATGDRGPPGRPRPAHRRAGSGPRLHREGKRPGPLRAHLHRPRTRAAGDRPVAGVRRQGTRGPDRLRQGARHSRTGDRGEAVLDRPEPVALPPRRRHPRRPLPRSSRTHFRDDQEPGRCARRAGGGARRFRGGDPCRGGPRAARTRRAARGLERRRGRARRRPRGRGGRSLGRYEVARRLRDAGWHAALRRAPRARAAGARPAYAAPQGRGGPALRRPGVRRALVDARAGSARRARLEHPETRHRVRAAQAVQGEHHRRRSGKPVRAVSAVLCDVRQGQRVQPEGRRGLHPPLRPRDEDRGRPRSSAPRAGRRRGCRLMTRHPTETPPPSPASPPSPPHQMWGGRFTLGPSQALDALNRSLPVDHRLWPQDVIASKAWVQALGRVGVLTPVEESQLLDGLDRVAERLADARRRVAELPLGSGALAGSGFAVDRVLLKEALGFRSVSANALDVTGDRDFVAEVLFAIALVGTHLSRLGAELIQYASSEYGFVRLADDFSTGSSLMPQKRNPDVFELARAKSARLLGDLVALLTTLKGIPAGYSKDLQEDKALLFDACDTLAVVLPAVTGAIASLAVDRQRMHAALDACLRATDLADLLVEAGVPFRESHGLVGKLVREAERAGVPLDRVPEAVAAGIHPALGAALTQLGTWEDSVEGRATPGGASRKSVEDQLEELRKLFAAAGGT